MTIEVAVYSIEGALRALQAGADRLELCAAATEGGTTPSFGVLESVRQNVSIDLFVMIRPRGGDFLYSHYEFHAMKRDIWQAMRQSADGVVLGLLTPEGRLDVSRCRDLVQRARPMKATLHRAFDLTRDPFEALEDAIAAGFDRILTSGHAPSAAANLPLVRELVARAGDRITIMPGAGITDENAALIVQQTGAREIHLSATAHRPTGMLFLHPVLGSEERLAGSTVRTVSMETLQRLREAFKK